MGKDTLDSEEIREDNRKGIILVSISLIIESASSVLIQILTRSSNPVEPLDIVMIRSVAQIIICSGYLCLIRDFKEVRDAISGNQSKYVGLRCLLGSIAVVMSYNALSNLSLLLTTSIFRTIPFLTMIFSFLIIGDKARYLDVFCMIGCFSGVLIIGMDSLTGFKGDNIMEGMVSCFVVALSFSLMVVITKKARRVNAVVLTFLLGVTLFVVSGSLLIMSGQSRLLEYSYQQLVLMLLSGVLNFAAACLQTWGFQIGKTTTLTMVLDINLIYSFAIDSVIFHRTILLNQILGSFVMVFFDLLAVVSQLVSQKEAQKGDAFQKVDNKPEEGPVDGISIQIIS